jgi:hypothetical protein
VRVLVLGAVSADSESRAVSAGPLATVATGRAIFASGSAFYLLGPIQLARCIIARDAPADRVQLGV